MRRVPDSSEAMFVAPTRNGNSLCVAKAGYVGCASADQLAAGNGAMSAGSTVDGGWNAFGLLADGAGSVVVAYPDGTTQQLAVDHNVVVAHLKSRPSAIIWNDAHGSLQTLKIGKPLSLSDLTPDEQKAVKEKTGH